jgi:spore maturation protein CgeB
MKFVVFGLSVSSSWGNGHATLWRGLCQSLARRGHRVVFFERDVPYYAQHRDLFALPGGDLILYQEWSSTQASASRHLADAEVAIVTSYCPDALEATRAVLDSNALHVFYDLDAPVTLDRIASGAAVDYVGPRGYRDFDLVLSYTGGRTLAELQLVLGARRVAPLYGSVDPSIHRPHSRDPRYTAEISYLGTYAADRDAALRALLVEPARRLPDRRFLIGGAMYGADFPWQPNVHWLPHVPACDHPAFYCSAKLTLNVTRSAMARYGFCPSGRLFEAAACGAPLLTDQWKGLDRFFEPGSEILVAQSTDDVLAALDRSPEDLAAIGSAARDRVLADHTADVRAVELEALLETQFEGEISHAEAR